MNKRYVFLFFYLFVIFCTQKVFSQADTQNNGSAFWRTKGNNSTDTANNFLGTKDAVNLTFRTNDIRRMTLDVNGNVGIGTTVPNFKFHVRGIPNNATIVLDGTISAAEDYIGMAFLNN